MRGWKRTRRAGRGLRGVSRGRSRILGTGQGQAVVTPRVAIGRPKRHTTPRPKRRGFVARGSVVGARRPEFVATRLRAFLNDRGITTMYVAPGKPWQNGLVESFNDRLREKCLNIEIFSSLIEAQMVIGEYREFYLHRRPHTSLSYLPRPSSPRHARRRCPRRRQRSASRAPETGLMVRETRPLSRSKPHPPP